MLQLEPVLRAQLGVRRTRGILRDAGINRLPSDAGLMPEQYAAALHQTVREQLGANADALLAEAGRRTGAYVIAHRIPDPVVALLQAMPLRTASGPLIKAVTKHAWTFSGSGSFAVASRRPLVFEVYDNPLIAGEISEQPLCVWHAAVFEHLFSTLVHPGMTCTETACAAQGDECCRFELC